MAFTPRQQQRPAVGKYRPNKTADKKHKLHNPAKPGLGKAPNKPKKAAAPRPTGRSAQPDARYQDRVDLVDRRATARLDDLGDQEQAIKHEFGIDDPTNPFSRIEGLKKAFLQRYRGQSATIAASGHLYGGQHERALARTRRDEEEARAGLRAQYEGAIGQIGAAKAGVKFDTEEQRMQAFEDWLARAPESEEAQVDVSAGDTRPGTPNATGQPSTIVGHVSDAERAAAIPGLPGSNRGTAKQTGPNKAAGSGSAKGGKTRVRNGKKEYQWPNGSWHSREYRGR